MQSLVGLLTGTGTADVAKQGALGQLAPAEVPANAEGIAFSDLFSAMLPAEVPVQKAAPEPAPKVVENDPASHVDAADDPEAQSIEGEILDAQQVDTPDQGNPKQALTTSSQPTEIREKSTFPQAGVEEWAAMHHGKKLATPTPASSAVPETNLDPDRPNMTPVRGNTGVVSKDEVRPLPIVQRIILRPSTQADGQKTSLQMPAHAPTPAQSQPSAVATQPRPVEPALVTAGEATTTPENARSLQVNPSEARIRPVQHMPQEVPELGKPGRPILTQNQVQPLAPKVQDQVPDLPAAPEVRATNKTPVRSMTTFVDDVAPPPIVNRETPAVPNDKIQPQIRHPLPTARFADPLKPDAAGTKTARASELPASNVAPALRSPIQPVTWQTQTGAQTPSTADRFNDLGRRHSYVEQSPIAPPRKPIPRLSQAHVEHLPAPPKAAAAQSSKIEPRQASQLQPQAQMQASPQTTSQIGATTAAAPMAKLQVDQRTEGRNNLSSGADFALSFRTELAASPTVMTPVMARPELASHVAQQIADAMQSLPNRPVEITLNPEELGRLKLHLVSADGGLAVHVTAERPETMDLLRRHIGILDQEFLKLGFEDVAFSFAGGQTPQDQADASKDQTSDQQTGNPDLPPPTNTVQATAPPQRGGGLDLRL
jgi:flagellar hook-length control protein FliK